MAKKFSTAYLPPSPQGIEPVDPSAVQDSKRSTSAASLAVRAPLPSPPNKSAHINAAHVLHMLRRREAHALEMVSHERASTSTPVTPRRARLFHIRTSHSAKRVVKTSGQLRAYEESRCLYVRLVEDALHGPGPQAKEVELRELEIEKIERERREEKRRAWSALDTTWSRKP